MSTQKNKRVAKIESTNKKTVEYNKKVVVEKNKGGRPSKRLKYVEERKDVLNKLYYILGVTENNTVFYFEDIDDDKKAQIKELEGDIKKYFNAGKWSCFVRNLDDPLSSLIRTILKDMKISTVLVYEYTEDHKVAKRGMKIKKI